MTGVALTWVVVMSSWALTGFRGADGIEGIIGQGVIFSLILGGFWGLAVGIVLAIVVKIVRLTARFRSSIELDDARR